MFGKKDKLQGAIEQEQAERHVKEEEARVAFGEAQQALLRLDQRERELEEERAELLRDPAAHRHRERLRDIRDELQGLQAARSPAQRRVDEARDALKHSQRRAADFPNVKATARMRIS